MITPDDIQLVERYVHGELAEGDVQRLETLLVESGEARAMLRSLATLDFGLHELSATAPVDADTGEEFSDVVDVKRDPAQRKNHILVASMIAAIAACLLIAVGVAVFRNGGSGQIANVPEDDNKVIATLVQGSDARWKGKRLVEGSPIYTQTLSLQSGMVRLLFVDGVEVTLEGPAEYEIVDVGRTRLASGLLTATVPPGAEGFRVDTLSAQVVDLGTAFGIDQRADGVSKVSVFDGEVEIVSRKDSGKRLLTEGESVQLDLEGSMSDIAFESQRFEKVWPIASGIVVSTGAFRFVPPWPRRLSLIQSDTEILVLPEGYAGKLEEPCPVDIAESELIESGISAGRRVRSFLLQFNPVDPPDQESISSGPGSRMRRIEGGITFDRPVIGLIVSSDTLKVTDKFFALRRGPIRPFKRGLELSPPRTADVVSLSEDRHTLNLKLAVFNQFSDHVRVIVDASLSDVDDQSVNSK